MTASPDSQERSSALENMLTLFLCKQEGGAGAPSLPAIRLNFRGQAVVTTSLCVGATVIWTGFYFSSAQRARAWYGCPIAVPDRGTSNVNANSGQDSIALRARIRFNQSCDSLAFYYGLLSGSVVVCGIFGLVGALGSLYIGKEGLAGAKNIAINASIASLGLFSLGQAIPAGFQAQVGLKAAAEDVVNLSAAMSASAAETSQSRNQSPPTGLETALARPRPIPAFNVEQSIFSILSGALSSSSTFVNPGRPDLTRQASQGEPQGQGGAPVPPSQANGTAVQPAR